MLDEIDYKFLELLQRDARMTQQEIADAVGLSQSAVAQRLRKLETQSVITGYVAQVDAHQLGKDITAFIGVGIEHPRFNAGFAKKMIALPEVLECHRVAGEYSYLLKIKTENTASLDHFLAELLRTIPGVTRSETTIVLASVKESTRIEASHSPSRLRVIGRSKEGA
jgi:Lrp/AsnC family transcriptional regulator, leucine-responsive regulatory protein